MYDPPENESQWINSVVQASPRYSAPFSLALYVSTLRFCFAVILRCIQFWLYIAQTIVKKHEKHEIFLAHDKYSEWLKQFIQKISIKLRFSVTCILYRRKLPDITQVLNVYVIHIKFLQNASFLRKLNPFNFALIYWNFHFLDHFNLWKSTLLNRTFSF